MLNSDFHVCVLGAGTMGSGIAAHLANQGFRVTLFDLTRANCRDAWDRAQRVKPPHVYGPSAAARVRLCGIQEDLDEIATADWVCEAIIEKLDAKLALYEQIEPRLPDHAMVSTNTSGLQIGLLIEGRKDSFRRKFVGTHFFNPPRYLKLLELIPTDETEPAEVKRITEFLEERVGRRVVPAKDTPGFIANRFGMWAMIHCIHVAEKMRLNIEDVDAMTGPFLGRPRSASFRLNDLVGLDIMADIAANLRDRCPDDEWKSNLTLPSTMVHLLEIGALGQKSGKGYYLREGKAISSLDLQTLLYRDQVEPDLPSLAAIAKLPLGERIRKALGQGDDVGEFMRRHLIPVMQYANAIREEVSHNVEDFDRVMMWGFGWEMGPFAMMDAIGTDQFQVTEGNFYQEGKMRSHAGAWIPTKTEPRYAPLKSFAVVSTHENFKIRDLGDGVVAVCLETKLGSITPALVRELTEWVKPYDGRFIIANTQRFFSVGYDLQFFLDRAAENDWLAVQMGLSELQQLCDLLRTKRCVAAVHGYCLGAGTEIAMACGSILAHPECQIGLPEMKVGLLPGGSGTAQMASRAQLGDSKMVVTTCLNVGQGVVGTCAADAQALGFLTERDLIALHPDCVVGEAKRLALSVEPAGPAGWKPPVGPVLGMIDDEQRKLRASGVLSEYDEAIADKIKSIFVRSTTWEDALSRERDLFVDLLRHPHTQARIRHMLETGKPLRN